MDYETARYVSSPLVCPQLTEPSSQHAFELLLDSSESATEQTVSLPTLKKLCARGIPERPVQWRPLAWEVLLGVRPREKERWERGERERAVGYYELVQQTTAALSAPQESSSLTDDDHLLLEIERRVKALGETPRSRWIRRRITYPRDHPFADDHQEASGEGVTVDRRGIARHLERIRNIQHSTTRSSLSADSSSSGPSQSPEITLSPSEDTHKKSNVRGPRAKTLPKNKNHLSLDIPSVSTSATTTIIVTAASPTTPVHPVTLVQPREISPRVEAAEQDPKDTAADALVRILCVLVRRIGLPLLDIEKIVEWAAILYAVFVTGGDVEALTEGDEWETEDHAEAETYWCLQVIASGAGLEAVLQGGSGAVSSRLARRVFWADEGLYRILMSLHLNLEKEPFVTEWTSYLFTRTIDSISELLPIWDAIFSEDEDPATIPRDSTGKAELLVDICTAMLLLVKDSLRTIMESHPGAKGRQGFWIEGEDDRLLFDEDLPDVPADRTEEKTAAARKMLRSYPIEEVGTDEVLRVAWEVRQRRVMAILDGEDLDDIALPVPLPSRNDPEGLASRLESLAAKAGSSVRETINPLPRYTVAPLVDMDTVKNTLASSGERLKDYAQSLQASDAAAQVSKASSNFTAVALMRLNSLSAGAQREGGNESGWSLGAAKRLWSQGGRVEEQSEKAKDHVDETKVQDDAPASSSGDALETPINDEPAALFRRDTNLPPSFITPRGSIIYPAGRYRPKASATGQAKPSLQSRLAAVAASPSAQPAAAVSPERSAVRPLILSRSAKPASPLHPTTASDTYSPSTLGRMSPSPSLQNLDVVENYVARKVSISRRSQRSSLGSVDRDESALEMDSTSDRLRKATRDSYPAAADARRYHLSDPGAKDEERPATPTKDADPERYQLRDGEPHESAQDQENSPDSRRESVDSAASGVTRSRVVRKGKFASKAAHFRLQSAGKIDLSPEMAQTNDLTDVAESSPLPARTSSLSQPTTPVNGAGTTTTPKSLILPERPERTSSLQNPPNGAPKRPSVDVQHLAVVKDAEEDEPLSAKDGYGDLLESYAAALESL